MTVIAHKKTGGRVVGRPRPEHAAGLRLQAEAPGWASCGGRCRRGLGPPRATTPAGRAACVGGGESLNI